MYLEGPQGGIIINVSNKSSLADAAQNNPNKHKQNLYLSKSIQWLDWQVGGRRPAITRDANNNQALPGRRAIAAG